MGLSVETEIKLAASPEMLAKLRAHAQLRGEDEQTATLITTYFDTVGGKLRRGGAALRVRQKGDEIEQTLKLESPYRSSVRRKEWNAAVASQIPQPSEFPAKARTALARLLDGAPLEAVATTRIERTTRRLQAGGSLIEIAFDIGSIEAGARAEDVCELELELIEGKLADVLELALRLPLGPELRWMVHSKAERCHALAFDLPLAASHARPVMLSPTMNAAQGFQTIAWNCLQQLLFNYPLVIASRDGDGLHQARVAIRRLRAAVSLFGKVTLDEAQPVLRAELKAVASGLGPARDLDVLHAKAAFAARDHDQDFAELLGHLTIRRDAALRSASKLLAAEPFQRLLFEFATWLESGGWLAGQSGVRGNQPLVPFAARVLKRRRRKLRRVDPNLTDLSDGDRHQLRIDVKKMRYAVGFFSSLFRTGSTARKRLATAKALDSLQDSLGELNDLAVASAARDALFAELEPITAARQMAQLDALLARQAKARGKLLKAARRSLAELARAPAWWKSG